MLNFHDSILTDAERGIPVREALARRGMKYTASWLAKKHIAELYIVDKTTFEGVWDPFVPLRDTGKMCKNLLKERKEAVKAAKKDGLII